jgi:RNA polymerase sigma-70 factor (ECF subfamily)
VTSFAVGSARSGTVAFGRARSAGVDDIRSLDDSARFRTLALPYFDDAYTLARWLTGSDPESEDVLRGACLRALREIRNCPEADPRVWVLTMVHQTAYERLHKSRLDAPFPGDDLVSFEEAHSRESDEEVPKGALIADIDPPSLKAAMATLPILVRELLVLHDLQGLAYRDVAKVTGLPIGTVMVQLAQARSSLLSGLWTGPLPQASSPMIRGPEANGISRNQSP